MRTHLAQSLDDRRPGGRGPVGGFFFGENLTGKRSRRERHGLGCRCRFAQEVGGRDGHVMPREERLARLAVKDPDMSAFQHLSHGGNATSVTRNLT
jgi:hypothetical protein